MSAQEQIETIFAAAIDIDDEGARRALVERACGGDVELRGRVEELLADHANAGSFLEGAAAPVRDLLESAALSAEVPGTVIGRYKLLERIGEGGMGVVFMAQQEQPVRRRVALKVIKAGMDTRQVVARFEAERQALALMDHPSIARVLDGGSTAGGRPYFVMELVQGSPITEYCDRNQLTARQRLELFVPVCQAVQHAHTKGIIHRDLKPGNVLVTLADGVPVPKVIDFGVAKAAGPALTEQTLFTQFAQTVGTPLYMSPEQAGSGLDVDTRSDVYSLGVLLYELLTGTTPFDKGRLGRAALEEVRRIIREEEPPKPSTRISTMGGALAGVSADRRIDAKKLGRLVRGELDWVVMRALEKDRARRYETANGLGKDVQRYLADEPVEASPPRTLYRVRKFARRNRRGLATAGVVVMAMILTLGALGWSARDRSVRRAALAQEIVSALNEAEAAYERDKLSDAEAAVKRAENFAAGAGGGIEPLRARVRQWRLDLETVATLEELRGSEGPITTKKPTGGRSAADLAYGDVLRQYGVDFEALEPAEVARRLRASAVRRHFIAALDHWTAWDYLEQRKSPAYGRLLAVAKGLDPDPWRDRLRDALGVNDKRVLADLLRDKEAVSQPPSTVLLLGATARPWGTAVPMLRGAQARHPGDFWLNYSLGQPVNHESLPMGQATGYARAAVSLRPGHFGARWNLAVSLRYVDLPQAAVEFREALRIRPTDVQVYSALVSLHVQMGDKEGAAAVARDMDGAKLDEKDLVERGNIYVGVGRWEDAINAYREALRLNPDDRFAARDLLIGALRHVSRVAELSDELREVLRRHPEYIWARTQLVDALGEQGLVNEAIGEARECVRRSPTDSEAHMCLAAALYRKGLIEEASEEYRQAIEMYPYDGDPLSGLYGSLLRDRRSAEACAAAEVLAAHGKSAGSFYNTACEFALAWPGAADDPNAQDRYAQCAIKLLAAAESRKKFVRRVDMEVLKRDPDLDALRRRPDFLALVARVEQTLAETARPPLPRVGPPPGPYLGFPAPVPGVVQAEHYDEGGEGVAYHDIDEQPALRGPRPADSVHLDACLDQGGGSNVGGVFAGEWLAYTVEVAGDAEYVLDFRLASPVGGGTLHVEFDGADKTGPVVIPKTGDWQAWQTVSSKTVRLKGGRQVMRLVFDTAGRTVWPCNVNWIEVRALAAQAAGAATRPVSPLGIKAK